MVANRRPDTHNVIKKKLSLLCPVEGNYIKTYYKRNFFKSYNQHPVLFLDFNIVLLGVVVASLDHLPGWNPRPWEEARRPTGCYSTDGSKSTFTCYKQLKAVAKCFPPTRIGDLGVRRREAGVSPASRCGSTEVRTSQPCPATLLQALLGSTLPSCRAPRRSLHLRMTRYPPIRQTFLSSGM